MQVQDGELALDLNKCCDHMSSFLSTGEFKHRCSTEK